MTRAKDISKILTAPVFGGLTYPTTDGSSNQFMKTDGSGTLSFSTVDLTALSASNLTSGTVPVARLGSSGTRDSTTFLRGDNTFATVTSTTINNNANNRIITGSGSANTLEGEANITFDGTNLDLSDSKYIRLGTGNDLQIYHDGSNSYVDDTGTGRLYLRGNDRVQIQKYTGEDMVTAIADGAVKLYHDNSKKLETTSTGIEVTGSIVGTTSIIPDGVDGAHLGSTSAEWSDLYLADGGIIYFGNDQDVYLEHVPDTGLRLPDNDKLMFGSSNDLEIFHNGTDSFIQDEGSGNLKIRTNGTAIELKSTADEAMIVATKDGAVDLYHNNSKKLETTSGGVTVTGTVSATNLTLNTGDINVIGTGNRAISVLSDNGLGTIEVGGASGGFIDIKAPKTDDFDLRLGASGTGGYLTIASGSFTFSGGLVNSVSGFQRNGTILPFQSTPTEASTASSIGIGTGYTTVISQAITHAASDRIIVLAQCHLDTQSSGTSGQGDLRILATNTSQSAEIMVNQVLAESARLRWNYTTTLRDSRGIAATTTYHIQVRKTNGSMTANGGGGASKIILIREIV